mgnify:CR=1 FL=1
MFSSQFENTVSSAASDAAVIKTKNTNQNAAVPIKPAILFEILTVDNAPVGEIFSRS